MEAVVIVTVLALVQYAYFGIQVGAVRGKTGIKAPAMSGDPSFERMNRVHMWLYAEYVQPLWGAAMGVVYLVGRFVYRAAYLKDPAGRGLGFGLTFLPTIVMLIWVLLVALKSYF